MSKNKNHFEDASPNPEYLIKSIAEQGYSLETSLADLMDNSISAGANKLEVLIDTGEEPFTLFLADNGDGMTEEELSRNMQFPSSSPDHKRSTNDLGRFGLGMKTASFSQTRKFTVLSRKIGSSEFHGRTWDVDFLRENGWKIIINTKEEIDDIIARYLELSGELLSAFDDFTANTIVIWMGLYKFENYLEAKSRKDALHKEITQVTTDYLSLVFHRFLEEKNGLKIRINNQQIEPFNPFPKGIRRIDPKYRSFKSDTVTIQGYVLPSESIKESQSPHSKWTTKYRGLMDMEGIYVYRANRIILFGGWNGLIRKTQRLQLARISVDVGNGVDHLLHLNVAKSQIVIPHELKSAFESIIEDVKEEAEREYYNRDIRTFSSERSEDNVQLFEKISTNKGSLLQLNRNFPIIKSLNDGLVKGQKAKLSILVKMINTRINSIRHVHAESEFVGVEDNDGISVEDFFENVEFLLKSGISKDVIKRDILPNMGFDYSSIPNSIRSKLDE